MYSNVKIKVSSCTSFDINDSFELEEFVLTTDNAADISLGIRDLGNFQWVSCMGHILNLLVQEGLKEDSSQKHVTHCSALVRYINKSELARRHLKEYEAYFVMPDLSMIQSSNVRWNKVVDILEL